MNIFKRKCCIFEIEPLDLTPLSTIKTYYEDSHDILKLMKCNKCGAFWLYEFHEWVDYNEGNDEIFETYAYGGESEAEALDRQNKAGHIRSMRPAIHYDYDDKEMRILQE
jgi:hypothetical protein